MKSSQKVIVRDLVEEAKKRIVFLVICVIGLSYLMSLTSSTVWVNLPAAASLLIMLRFFSLDYEMRRRGLVYNKSKSEQRSAENALSQRKPHEFSTALDKSDWRSKVNSPVVEDAVDKFTKHIVAEWVTDLWYSKLTPDKQGPEELVYIINGVVGELSIRMRNVNLIDLLTRDIIHLICTHLELFRASQAKVKKPRSLKTIEQRDEELRLIMATDNKLHPALFSAEAEHKVLQHVMDGLISSTFRPEDLRCSFFRYITRELLACAVIRPVLNLANPRFINERIEGFVLSRANKGVSAQEASKSKPNESSRTSSDHLSKFSDPTGTGIELMLMKNEEPIGKVAAPIADNISQTVISKDPLLSMDTRSSCSWSSLPVDFQVRDRGSIARQSSLGEGGEILDMMSHRKSAALAPDNFENMWTKGRDYKTREGKNHLTLQVPQMDKSRTQNPSNNIPKPRENDKLAKSDNGRVNHVHSSANTHATIETHCLGQNASNHSSIASYAEDDDEESSSISSHTSEEEDISSVTGLGSPGTMVWDGKKNRNPAASHIHHPLENLGASKKTTRKHTYQKLPGSHTGRKRSRTSNREMNVWKEIERTSFVSGDGLDILRSEGHINSDDSSEDSDLEISTRAFSGITASSSTRDPENLSLSKNSTRSSSTVDSFYKLRCEVLGANIVKSASRMFAVYSISATDATKTSWSIKRRYRHFEELHRRLKEYPEYSLHLPPKHFLSTGLEVAVVLERCKLLDEYLQKLMQLPTISGSIEVWDFLSVDSQTYVFSNSFSIIETLSVDHSSVKNRGASNFVGPTVDPLSSSWKQHASESKASVLQTKPNFSRNEVRIDAKDASQSPRTMHGNQGRKLNDGSCVAPVMEKSSAAVRNVGKTVTERCNEESQRTIKSHYDTADDPTIPTEWVPPKLTVPMLDLVEVIFQFQDSGWIRRNAFWVAKQVLQLGMGDALDDWLVEKILHLCKGSVVASGVQRLEQILWPDGIFITKRPKRQPPTNVDSVPNPNQYQQASDMASPRSTSDQGQQSTAESSTVSSPDQQQEANEQAKFVYKLMIENAPAAVVSLVGRKVYEQCVEDLYFFLQSSVCMKQLAYELLELLLLSAFPELEHVIRELHEEKHKFGEFIPNK